jgi:hypothetical protein
VDPDGMKEEAFTHVGNGIYKGADGNTYDWGYVQYSLKHDFAVNLSGQDAKDFWTIYQHDYNSRVLSAAGFKGYEALLGVGNEYLRAQMRLLDKYSETVQFKPMYKKDLKDIMISKHYSDLSENAMGAFFEMTFEANISSVPNMLTFHHFRKYFGSPFNTGNRNSKPDFVADIYVTEIFETGVSPQGRQARRYVLPAAWYECKNTKNQLYLSSNTNQIKGHVDNLASSYPGALWRKYGYRPQLILATTADVTSIASIIQYANIKQVGVTHIVAQHGLLFGIIRVINFDYQPSNLEFGE